MTQILYVDDEPINLSVLKALLRTEYKVYTASNALEGLSILEESPTIKHVISDLKMPGMDGLEFIAKARAKYPEKKFYLLSGFHINEKIQNALDNSLILNFFEKPFDLELIRKALILNE